MVAEPYFDPEAYGKLSETYAEPNVMELTYEIADQRTTRRSWSWDLPQGCLQRLLPGHHLAIYEYGNEVHVDCRLLLP